MQRVDPVARAGVHRVSYPAAMGKVPKEVQGEDLT